MIRYWHPFADMHVVPGNEFVIDRGEGAQVWDTAGRPYLDATAALWYCNVGYGRREIVDAVADQMARLHAYSNFGPYATAPTMELAERLISISPIEDAAVFFTSGGSEAVETAAKLARRYWAVMGRPEREIIVSRENSYHGMAAFGTSLAGIPGNRAGYGSELVGAVEHVASNDAGALAALLADHGDRMAAFIGEPVIGAGGVIPPAEGYWAEVSRLCQLHDVLLVADEVVTGFGRLGDWFATTTFGIQPDIITFAKGVTSGYIPFGGIFVGPRVAAPFWTEPTGAVFRHGYTYSGHAAGSAAALANLDIIVNDGLLERVGELSTVLSAHLQGLAGHPLVGGVRSIGLLGAVELADEAIASNPGIVDKVVAAARENGVLTRNLGGRALQISPPYVISPDQIEGITRGLRMALD